MLDLPWYLRRVWKENRWEEGRKGGSEGRGEGREMRDGRGGKQGHNYKPIHVRFGAARG